MCPYMDWGIEIYFWGDRMTGNLLFTYNLIQSEKNATYLVECPTADTVERIYFALKDTGSNVFKLNLTSRLDLEIYLKRIPAIDFVFNIAEGFLDMPRTIYDGSGAACVKKAFNQLNLPVSHSGIQAMVKCRNKKLTNFVLRRTGIPTPRGFSIYNQTEIHDLRGLQFPVFVKPLGGGNSLGIDEGSLVENLPQLEARASYLLELLNGTGLLVEEYLPGPEYTVAVMGGDQPIVLPPIWFGSGQIRSTDLKSRGLNGLAHRFIGHEEPIYLELADLAVKTYGALGAADAIRVDVKECHRGEKYIIDVNGTPSLNYHGSLCHSARYLGIDFPQTIALILACSLRRHGLPLSKKLDEMIADLSKTLEPYRYRRLPAENRELVL